MIGSLLSWLRDFRWPITALSSVALVVFLLRSVLWSVRRSPKRPDDQQGDDAPDPASEARTAYLGRPEDIAAPEPNTTGAPALAPGFPAASDGPNPGAGRRRFGWRDAAPATDEPGGRFLGAETVATPSLSRWSRSPR